MRHAIDRRSLGADAEGMLRAIEGCVHCGFCLAACPTYDLLGEEMDSPRGRILLMKGVLEGDLELAEARPFIDRCVGCLACEPACPSGVPFRQLLHPFRRRAEEASPARGWARLVRLLAHATLPHPGRFRVALAAARLGRGLAPWAPARLRPLLKLGAGAPRPGASLPPLPALFPARGRRRARVALLSGCVQQVLAPEIGWATLRVLAANGVETLVPAGQGCCGSLALHDGEWRRARTLARRNLDVFPADVDAVVTNAAGCGSGMREYQHLFAGQVEAEAARRLAARVVDVAVFLDELGLLAPPSLAPPLRVAYQDACHLAQAQGVKEAPRRLLRAIGGVELLEVAEPDLCCGSAGTYNPEQPELAARLGERKVTNLLAVAPDLVASGNIGCLVQIRGGLAARGSRLPAVHTLEVLDRAYGS